jgi:hypothetical protein
MEDDGPEREDGERYEGFLARMKASLGAGAPTHEVPASDSLIGGNGSEDEDEEEEEDGTAADETEASGPLDEADWLRKQQELSAMFKSLYSNQNDVDDEQASVSDEDDGKGNDDGAHKGVPAIAESCAEIIPCRPPGSSACNDMPMPPPALTATDAPIIGALPDDLAPVFADRVRKLAPLVQAVLLGHVEPESVPVDSLLGAIGRLEACAKRAAYKEFDIMRVPGALSCDSCARLREAVDRERCTLPDSVDALPEHQLKLDHTSLKELVGADGYSRLMRLPVEYVHAENALLGGEPVDEATALRFATLQEAFIRRYSAETRPWNPFHQDKARITVNVAVSSDAGHGGGRLVGVYNGALHTILRDEGEATVHSSELFHCVP